MNHKKGQEQAQQYPGMELAEVAFRDDIEISALAAELRKQEQQANQRQGGAA